MVTGSIKELFSFDFVNIYLFSIFFSIAFVNIYFFSIFLSIVFAGSRTIAPEENCPPTLILTLTLNQTLILTGGQFSSGAIVRTPFCQYLSFLNIFCNKLCQMEKVGVTSHCLYHDSLTLRILYSMFHRNKTFPEFQSDKVNQKLRMVF